MSKIQEQSGLSNNSSNKYKRVSYAQEFKSNLQEIKQERVFIPRRGDDEFKNLYNQNLHLKKRQESLHRHIEQLKNQLNLNQTNHMNIQVKKTQRQLNQQISLKRQNINLNQQINSLINASSFKQSNRNNKVAKTLLQAQKNKIKDLCQLIQKLKQNLKQSQKLIKKKNTEIDLLRKQKNLEENRAKDIEKYANEGNTVKYQSQHKLKQAQRDLQKQKQKVFRLESKIKTFQFQMLQIKRLRQDNISLKQQVKKLQKLHRNNISSRKLQNQYSNIQIDAIALKRKNQEQQEQIDRIKAMYVAQKTQAEMFKNQCHQIRHKLMKYQAELPGLRKKARIFPLINQLCLDQQQMYKMLLQKKEMKNDANDYKKVQQLTLKNGQLVGELKRIQSMYKLLKEQVDYKQRLHRIEAKGQKQIIQKKFIEDNRKIVGQQVSVFSDVTKLQSGYNYFDLYLGEAHLMQQTKWPIIFTVDFYNHQTLTTKEGKFPRFNFCSEFNFKVTQDQFLIQYLQKGYVIVQCWQVKQNGKCLGEGRITLSSLLSQKKEIINSSAALYYNNKLVGSITFYMRLRSYLPRQLKKQQSNQIKHPRKLVVHIIQAEGLPSITRPFVYYKLQMKDYFTPTVQGSSAYFDCWNLIQVSYTEQLKMQLKKKPIQFNVLDDNAPLNNDDFNDLIGIANIDCRALLSDLSIDVNPEIKNDIGKTVGYMHIRLFWHDKSDIKVQNFRNDYKLTQAWEIDIKNRIIQAINRQGLSPIQAFKLFDKDDDKIIGSKQFEFVCNKELNLKISHDDLLIFYGRLPHPLNLQKFQNHFGSGRIKSTSIKVLNKMLQENTKKLTEPPSFKRKDKLHLNQFIRNKLQRGKTLIQLSLQIDVSGDGFISRKELQQYFQEQMVQIPSSQITKMFQMEAKNNRIQLIKFLTHFKGVENINSKYSYKK